MKQAVSIFMAVVILISLAACGQTATNESGGAQATTEASSVTDTASDNTQARGDAGEILIAYFSWSASGNTEKMANTIKERTGADILKIEPAIPYPKDYNECGDVAKLERDENARPQIANQPASADEYGTIFIGYPIWWHTAPMIIGTFLESVDLSGKEVYPFTQSASMDTEHFENSMEFVRECAKGSTVHDGLFANASDTDKILAYLDENGF